MGRNKEPIKLILSKGKAHKTKAEIKQREKSEVPVVANAVEPPAFLTTKAQREKFKKISGVLMEIGIMSDLDCDVLGRYIKAEEDWVAYGKLVKKAQKSLNKALSEDDEKRTAVYTDMLAKYEALRVKAFNQCHTCASSLGLTITSRCRIAVPEKEEKPKENKFAEYLS